MRVWPRWLISPTNAQAVVFCDADGADQLSLIDQLVLPVMQGEADLVIGSRALGGAEAGALSLPQRVGNRIATMAMRLLYGERVTDLGPFRCVSVAALRRLAMSDPTYGWTTEMQVKAFRLQLRVLEVPVRAQLRTAGESKISGKLIPGIIAGKIILSTVWRYHRLTMDGDSFAPAEDVKDTKTAMRENCASCRNASSKAIPPVVTGV